MNKKADKVPVIAKSPHLAVIYVVYLMVLFYILRPLPDFSVWGIEETMIRSTAAMGPVNGIILGPVLGVVCMAIQVYSSVILAGGLSSMPLGPFTPLTVISSTLVAGLFIARRPNMALAIPIGLIMIWYLMPTGREAFTTPWLLILSIAVFYLYRYDIDIGLNSLDWRRPLPIFSIALIAVLTDHMMGNLLALFHYNIPASMYNSTVMIFPAERLILASMSTVVIFGLINEHVMDVSENIVKRVSYIGGSAKPSIKVNAGQDLPAYRTYLFTEEENTRILEVFSGMLSEERWGLCITRTYPDIVREVYGLLSTPVIWLSEEEYEEDGQWRHLESDGYEKSVDPRDIDKIRRIIIEFIRRTEDSVLLLDGLDLIAESCGFHSALSLMHDLHKMVKSKNTRLIVSVNPRKFSDVELARLRSEMEVIVA